MKCNQYAQNHSLTSLLILAEGEAVQKKCHAYPPRRGTWLLYVWQLYIVEICST